MSKLFPIFLIAMALASVSHHRSPYDPNLCTYRRREVLAFFCMSLILVLFVGLRIHYNDTDTYRSAYENITFQGSFLNNISFAIGDNPGFVITRKFFRLIGISTQTFLLIFAAVTDGIYLWFIRKYTCNIWLSVFLFITTGSYTFTMAAIKQCVAIAFCLVGVDRAIQHRWIRFLLWIALATVFHPYSLMFLLVPLLFFVPWSRKTYLLLVIFTAAGFLLQPLMNTVIDVTTMLGEEYNAATFSGEGVNPFRLAVVSVPIALSFITKKVIWMEHNRINNLLLNLTMLNATIMFVALFGTANYFARLANYFLIFQSLSLPWLFTHFETRSRNFITVCAVICYFLFFYYSNAIDQPFDHAYYGISLWQYLTTLF